MNCNFTTKNQNKIKSLLLTVAVVIFSCLAMSAWGQTTVPFTSSGTWTVPAGVTQITIHGIGGGGGGGTAKKYAAAGGGGGGAYDENTITVTPGQTLYITVGSGGNSASAGTASKVGSSSGGDNYLNANGGSAGTSVEGSYTNRKNGAGGQGGTKNSSHANSLEGGRGRNGKESDSKGGGGGGASGPGFQANLVEGTGMTGQDGYDYNGGSGDGGEGGTSGISDNNRIGKPGNNYGGGGGGAYCGSASGTFAGGSGAQGIVWITYTLPVLQASISATNTNLCGSQEITLTANVSGNVGTTSYQWKVGDNVVGTESTLTVTPTTTTTYTLTVTADNGTETVTQAITVHSNNTANAGSDGFICGRTGELWASHVLTSDTMYHPVWSCTSSDVTITNAGQANATVTLASGVTLPASRTFTWTYNNSGACPGSSDHVVVTFDKCDPAGCLADGTLIFKEDFGGNSTSDPNFAPSGLPDGITTLSYHPNKIRVPEGTEVQYGIYNLIKDGMTNGGWSEPGDHTTPGDNSTGYFMEIDGRGEGVSDQFYQQTISGLCPNTLLYFTYWLVNVNSEGQTQLELVIKDHDGNILRQQSTGIFNNTSWTQQGTVFTVPEGVNEVTFYLINNEGVESGNDFGLDDIEVRLCTAPAYASFDGPNTICYGGTTTLIGQYTDDGRSFLAPSYQWFSSADGSNWTAISGATSLNYTVANATSSMYYRLAVAGSATQVADETSNCRSLSDPIFLTVKNPSANDDAFSRSQDLQSLSLDVLDNDGIEDSDTVAIATPPTHGTATWNSTTHLFDYVATGVEDDSFTYTLTTGGCSATAKVDIKVSSLTLDCPTGSNNCYSFPEATFHGVARTIQVNFTEDPENCNITLPTLPTGWESEPTTDGSNNIAWFVSVPETATEAEVNAFLRGITFCIPASSIKDVTILVDGSNTPSRVFYCSETQHYYQYVPFTAADNSKTWMDCYDAAKGMTYLGRQGYLATLTSLDEDKFVTRMIQAPAWVGATRLGHNADAGTMYYASFNGADENNPSNNPFWYWACGPEKGTTLLNTVSYPSGQSTTTLYENQGVYSNWAVHEPNSKPDGQGSSYESCLTILRISSSGYTGWQEHTPQFAWNDKAYSVNNINNPSEWSSQGYLVEFGDMTVGNSTPDVFDYAVQANGKVGEFNPGMLSGSQTVCLNGTASIIEPTDAEALIEPISYKWFCNDVEISGATGTTYDPSSYTSTVGTYVFKRQAKDSCATSYVDASGSYTLEVKALPTVSVNNTAICLGQQSATLTATASSDVTGYKWSTNETTASITVSPTVETTYKVTVSTALGCTATADATVTVNPLPTVTVTPTDVLCNGESNGKLAVTVSGGTPSYTIYNNSTSAGTLAADGTFNIENLATGSYTIMVEDAHGCQTTLNNQSVSQPNALTATITSSTQETCAGNDGTATVTATGGNGGYTYAWSNSSALATATGLSSFTNSGVYTVTVTDSKNCTASTSVTITLNNPLDLDPITIPPVCSGYEFSYTPQNGTDGTIPTGTTYSWPAPDAITGVSGLAAGENQTRIHGTITNGTGSPVTISYDVTPKNGVCVGTSTTASITIESQINPLVEVEIADQTVCPNNGDLLINASFTNVNSVHNVVWKWGSETVKSTSDIAAATTTDSYTIPAATLAADCDAQYTLRVEYTDASGCTASDDAAITVRIADWSINTSTFPNGTANVECVTSATDPSALAPTGAQILDGCGLPTTRSLYSTVTSPDPIVCEGTVTYTYRYTACDDSHNDWTYTYNVKDVTVPVFADDILTTKPADIDQSQCKFTVPDLTADVRAKVSDNCTESSKLVITQVPTAGTVITNDTNVVVTVKDNCQKQNTHTVNVTVPTLPTVILSAGVVDCKGNATGSASVTASNGTPGYTYLWSNGETTAAITDLTAGEYSVTVTDANGCKVNDQIEVAEPDELEVTIASTDNLTAICYGGNIDLTATAEGGNDTYTYAWTGSQITTASNIKTINVAPTTTTIYTVTVTDVKNCSKTANFELTVNPIADATISGVDEICKGDFTTLSVPTATTGSTYEWSNGSTATSINVEPTTTTTYGVTVTTPAGCVSEGEIEVVVDELPVINLNDVTGLCPTIGTKELTATLTTTTEAPYQYVWSGDLTVSPASTADVSETSNTVTATIPTACSGNYEVFVKVVDNNGCKAINTAMVNVKDNESPTFTRPADITIYKDANCNYDASVTATGDVTDESDNCSTGLEATYTDNDVTPTGACEGKMVIERTWHLVDNCGNAADDQVQTITVEDNIKPTFTRPADITIYKDASCNYDASVAVTGDVTDEADNCSTGLNATYTDRDVTPTTACEGKVVIERTWHLVDNCGNAAADQVQTITVEDNIKPTFTRPADITIYKDATCNYDASVAVTGDVADEADNCSTGLEATYTDAEVTPAGACEGKVVIERTWHLVDDCGNAAADQVQTITIEDNTPPTFTRPADITIYKDAICDYDASVSVTGDVTDESDNCSTGLEATYTDADATPSDACQGTKVIKRTWHLVDNCGNAADDQVQTITVLDNTAPTFTRPADITIYKDASCNYSVAVAVTGDVTDEADNCSTGLEATYTDAEVTPAGACEGKVVIERTWHLVDNCGNAADDQVQTITVLDNTAPTFTRPADITIYKDATCDYDASVSVTGDVTDESDNCSTGLEATYTDADATPSDACQGTKVIKRTWHLVDNCGNAADDQVQTITVLDNTAPTFTRPADITIYKDASCNYSVAVAVTGDVTDEADNCSTGLEATYTDRDVTPTTACEGKVVIERTWHLVDDCGNAAADQVQTITIEDNTPPTFTRPADITIYKDATCDYDASVSVTGDVADEADNCSTGLEATYTDADATPSDACQGTKVIKRTWHLVDNCGNAADDQVQTITVLDNTAPTFTRPADITIYKDASCNYSVAVAVTGDVTDEADNCSTGLEATYTDAEVTPAGACEGKVVIERTWHLVDDCGNAAADQVQTITIEDNTPPTFTRPADITIYKDATCNYDASVAVTGDVADEADNCSTGLEATYTDADATPSDACQGKKVIKRTWHLVDDCGNAAADQVQTITVEDTTRPVIATTNIDRELTSTNCTFLVPDLTAEVKAMSTDNCSDAAHLTATQDVAAGTTMLPGETKTVTVTVTDDCGNKNTKAVEITTPSQLTVAVDPATDVICYYGSTDLEAMPAGGRAAYGYAWSTSENTKTITVAPTATTTYNVTVTDANGCTATANSTVTVKPVALGMDNKTPYIRCNGDAFSVTPTGTLIPAGTQYVWTVDANANVTGQSAQSTPVDAPISQNLTNNSTTKQTVVYHVTPVTDGCSGDAFTITVDVEPTPDLTLTCPADVNRTLEFGSCALMVDPADLGTPTWAHSLGWTLINITNNAPADNIYPEGDNVITWTMTDECGNTTTCEQHVFITFPECPDAVDFEGNVYDGVRVGCNCWTQRNLESNKYSDGSDIPGIYNYYSDVYPDVNANVSTFGRLYDWPSVIGNGADNGNGHVQGICPDGWYLPTAQDFESLNQYGAEALKSPNYWLDGGGSNSTGFTSLPGGYYDGSIDRYMNLMGEAYYWSTSKVDDHWTPVPCNIHYTCNAIINASGASGFGYSVRCIKEKE